MSDLSNKSTNKRAVRTKKEFISFQLYNSRPYLLLALKKVTDSQIPPEASDGPRRLLFNQTEQHSHSPLLSNRRRTKRTPFIDTVGTEMGEKGHIKIKK